VGSIPIARFGLEQIGVVVRRRDLDRLEAVTRGDAEARQRNGDEEARVCPREPDPQERDDRKRRPPDRAVRFEQTPKRI
jgi:hypothetical protein